MKIDICLPIKNEAAILEANLEKIFAVFSVLLAGHDWRVIAVINGSSDESWAIASRLAEKRAGNLICQKLVATGKGGAIKHAWHNSDTDILVFFDIDLAISPEMINAFLVPLLRQEADLVISSRFLPTASFSRSRRRTIISRGYINLTRLILGHSFSDLQCGFKAITKKAFQQIEGHLLADGWFFDTELVILADRLGLQIKEVPVSWRETRDRKQKSGIKIIRDSKYFFVSLLRFCRRLKKIKKKYRGSV